MGNGALKLGSDIITNHPFPLLVPILHSALTTLQEVLAMFAEVLLAGALALGGWGAAGCGPVGPDATGHEWRQRPDDPGRSYLYRRGVQVAGYDHQHNVYRAYDARTDTWGPPQAPPWKTPLERAEEVRNF